MKIKLIFFIFVAAFLYVSAVNIFAYPISHYDDAAYASVAKNLAFGYGYSSYLYKGSTPVNFNSMISTGPTLIIPTALLIKVFSNKLWVPGLSAALINAVLLCFIFWLPKKFNIASDKKLWLWRAVFIWLLFCASTFGGLHKWAQFNQMFASMFGEAPAALFVILSLFVLVYSKNLLLSGVLAGLAVKSKLISVLHIFAILIFVFTWHYKKGMPVKKLFYYFLGLAIPYALFDIYKLSSLGPTDYLLSKKQEITFVVGFNSGLNSLNAFLPKAINAAKILKNSFGIPKILFCAGLAYYSVRTLVLKPYDNKNRLFADSLIFAFVCNLAWYVFFSSQPFVRHLFMGWVMLLLGISFYIFIVNNLRQKIFYFVIILFIVITSISPTYKAARSFDFTFNFAYVQDVQNVKNVVLENPKYNYFAAGWWIPWEVQYLLPTAADFKNITEVGKFNGTKNKVLIRNKKFYNLVFVPMYEEIKNIADTQKIYENDNYVISKIDDNIKIAE